MKRRIFIGTMASIPFAGCTSVSTINDGNNMNVIQPEKPLTEYKCPQLQEKDSADNNIDKTICIRRDNQNNGINWSVSKHTLSAPSDSTTFTVDNTTGEGLDINPANWRTAVLTESGWTFLAPERHQQTGMVVESGQSLSWNLTLGENVQSSEVGKGDESPKTHAPKPGIYLFRVLVGEQKTTIAYVGLLKLS